jgi:hypothetical protein
MTVSRIVRSPRAPAFRVAAGDLLEQRRRSELHFLELEELLVLLHEVCVWRSGQIVDELVHDGDHRQPADELGMNEPRSSLVTRRGCSSSFFKPHPAWREATARRPARLD